MKLRFLGKGLFREGFKVVNSDVVVKFPLEFSMNDDDPTEGRIHSKQEIRRLKRLKKEGTLKRYLPEIFYYNTKTGVIAMRYYEEFDNFEEQADAMGQMMGTLIPRVTRVRCDDIHTENIRRGPNDRAILIDLGY
jgi:hypothetical protein